MYHVHRNQAGWLGQKGGFLLGIVKMLLVKV
jgi:hypothetical protein